MKKISAPVKKMVPQVRMITVRFSIRRVLTPFSERMMIKSQESDFIPVPSFLRGRRFNFPNKLMNLVRIVKNNPLLAFFTSKLTLAGVEGRGAKANRLVHS
jgi:hypothetical protein